jgi:MoaA/NifB/PqqE/SkfB family radical SAM enzyme
MTNARGFSRTTRRVLTRRGVVWLGQTCNLRCHFCYFQNRIASADHPDHPFMSLHKAKAVMRTLAETYGNVAVDIQGGEPTIYPGIEELTRFCRELGLLPTLITNALVLADAARLARLRDAGLRDLLISVHGLGEDYDRAVGVSGAHDKQMRAIDNCVAQGVAFRFNCVLAASCLPHLADVAALAVDKGARVVNFIAFNPFEDQQSKSREARDVPRYAEVAGPLIRALDILRAAGVEANVRYLPLCVVPEQYREHFYNFQQLPYDLHEWDYASWSWSGMPSQRRKEGGLTPTVTLRQANAWSKLYRAEGYLGDPAITPEDAYRHSAIVRAREHCKYQYAPACDACGVKALCDGFHGDYAGLFGLDEVRPIALPEAVDDPKYFIARQDKIVEDEDAGWAG